jgi:RNA polymerase sigma factor (sigma-70 family)
MAGNNSSSAEIEAIYRERFRAFLFTATALLGDGDAALDVVQDGFALALRRRASFRGEGSLEAWLWRIVLNVARDRRRSRRRQEPFVPLELFDASEPSDDLRAALLALPERQRLAVFLRYYADLSYKRDRGGAGRERRHRRRIVERRHTALRRNLEEVAR